jgi:hypothetical protein
MGRDYDRRFGAQCQNKALGTYSCGSAVRTEGLLSGSTPDIEETTSKDRSVTQLRYGARQPNGKTVNLHASAADQEDALSTVRWQL